jgi:2-polyprenyl-6-methoxyphenol hydroxylase-like FAD-dependent oxidoreductase
MQSKRQLDPDVLIVGAGPTGLLLACELLRHGLKVRIIDVGEGPPLCSKAQFIQTRTLEILEQMGIVERFLALGRPLYGLSLYSPDMKRLFHFNIGEMDSRYPFTLSLPQNDTEQLLIKHLADLGGHIECPVRFLGLTQTDDRVTVRVQRVQDDEDPEIDEIRAAWVVGCDGAHSAVRHCLGIDFCGNTYEQRIIQADVRIDWPLRHAEDEIIGFLSPRGPTMAVPLPGEQRYRLLGFDTGLAPTLGSFQFLLDERSAAGARVSDPVWMIEYAIHCRMAAQFRIGRVFLAGDAAHTVNPVTSPGDEHRNAGCLQPGVEALARSKRARATQSFLVPTKRSACPFAAALLKAPDAVVQELGSLLARYSQVAQGLRGSLLSFVAEMGLVERRTSRGPVYARARL